MSDRAEKLVEVLTALSMAEALPRGTVKEDVIKTRAHVELSRETLGRLLKDMRSELFDVQSLPNEPFTDFLKEFTLDQLKSKDFWETVRSQRFPKVLHQLQQRHYNLSKRLDEQTPLVDLVDKVLQEASECNDKTPPEVTLKALNTLDEMNNICTHQIRNDKNTDSNARDALLLKQGEIAKTRPVLHALLQVAAGSESAATAVDQNAFLDEIEAGLKKSRFDRKPLCREDCERFHIYLSEVLSDPEYDSKDRARPLLKSINARLKRIENKSAAVVEVKHDAGSPKLPEQAKKSSSKKRAAAEMTTEEKKDVRRKLQRRWRNAKSLEKKTELDTEIRALDVEIAGLKISEALPGMRLAHAKTEQALSSASKALAAAQDIVTDLENSRILQSHSMNTLEN
ncbi:unnamed protein product [Effrenium voratum]|nr:unnamed protein product [Effrenium voratum]